MRLVVVIVFILTGLADLLDLPLAILEKCFWFIHAAHVWLLRRGWHRTAIALTPFGAFFFHSYLILYAATGGLLDAAQRAVRRLHG